MRNTDCQGMIRHFCHMKAQVTSLADIARPRAERNCARIDEIIPSKEGLKKDSISWLWLGSTQVSEQ